MTASQWRPMPAFARDVPALLVLPAFGPSCYTLHITDMANVWTETLDRKGIMSRSLRENTSIDPTEGTDQMDMLLTKIQAAFDPSSPDYHQTDLELAASSDGKNQDGLHLIVKCTLPGNLEPLKWPVQLTKCRQASLTSEFVIPLVQAQEARAREIKSLFSVIKEKDTIISKLIDKLDATGTGLEDVFNFHSGKRKATRAAAEDKVKGLAPFRESDWRSKGTTGHATQKDVRSLLHSVWGKSWPVNGPSKKISTSDSLNNWWTGLGHSPVSAVKPGLADDTKRATETQSQSVKASVSEDEDDLQVQATPPHLANRARGDTAMDNDTTMEAEHSAILDSQPTSSQQSMTSAAVLRKGPGTRPASASMSSQHDPAAGEDTASEPDGEPVKPPSDKSKPRLGVIGGKRKPSAPAVKSPSPVRRPDHDSDATASASDGDEPAKKEVTRPSVEPPPARKRAAIGKIGGKVKPTSEPPTDNRSSTPVADAKPAAASPLKGPGRKIGAIGKKASTEEPPPMEDTVADPAGAEDEEDEETRERKKVERRRIQLAQELEKKASAPAKKKRKF